MTGLIDVPSGRIAAVVTSLEMTTRPRPRPEAVSGPWALRPLARDDLAGYRTLFRTIGADWLWFSRLRMADEALAAILGDPAVLLWGLTAAGEDAGILELDFRARGECELSFFGVARDLVGCGAGRWLMNRALEHAWSRPIERFWVHSCTLDHPAALAFYIRSGFRPYARQVEIVDDPRLTGDLPADAAPSVPLL